VTEAEWLAATDPTPLLNYLHESGALRDRKLGLYFTAYMREFGPSDIYGQMLAGWERQERDLDDLDEMRLSRGESWPKKAGAEEHSLRVRDGFFGQFIAIWGLPAPDQARHAALIRDLFRGPTRERPKLPGAWRTQQVMSTTAAIYDARAFERLPLLADLLQESGCTDAGLLEHLRGSGPHLLGCWAVDFVLGKT